MSSRGNNSVVKVGFNYQPYNHKKYSIFSTRPYNRDMTRDDYTTIWERLTAYCQRRFVTRKVVKTLARKKWIAVSSFRNRIYVCEMCTEEIDEYLGV